MNSFNHTGETLVNKDPPIHLAEERQSACDGGRVL